MTNGILTSRDVEDMRNKTIWALRVNATTAKIKISKKYNSQKNPNNQVQIKKKLSWSTKIKATKIKSAWLELWDQAL